MSGPKMPSGSRFWRTAGYVLLAQVVVLLVLWWFQSRYTY